jgi:hypothetical protein
MSGHIRRADTAVGLATNERERTPAPRDLYRRVTGTAMLPLLLALAGSA